MTPVFESLQQFFWAGIEVLNSVLQLFRPHLGLYLALALWIVFWVGAVNWYQLRRVLLAGGWLGLLLVGLVAVLVWGSIAPPVDRPDGMHHVLGLRLSNYVGKTVYVTGLICIAFVCGSVQMASGPPKEEEPPVTPELHVSH